MNQSGSLTAEQLRLIEERRREALAKLAAKQKAPLNTPPAAFNKSLPSAMVDEFRPPVSKPFTKTTIEAGKSKYFSKLPSMASASATSSTAPIVPSSTNFSSSSSNFPSSASNSFNAPANNSSTFPPASFAPNPSTPALIQSNAQVSSGQWQKAIDHLNIQVSGPNFVTCQQIPLLQDIISSLPGARLKTKEREWEIPLTSYAELVSKLPVKLSAAQSIPKNVLSLLLSASKPPDPSSFRLTGLLDARLEESLFPFQREGVQRALARQGRLILADDMGLGKSIQAIAIASVYRAEWPLLIVAPASMVASWHEQILRWIPSLEPSRIRVAYDSKNTQLDGLVNICSFDLLVRMAAQQAGSWSFRVIIVDECHALKNADTKRSKTLVPMCQAADRAILLSGTPALSRPVELYPQIQAVMPKLFPRFFDYGHRYCGGKMGAFGWDWRGASNLRELNVLLERFILIRRTKDQVMSQLPRKLRKQVFLHVPPAKLQILKGHREVLVKLGNLFDSDDGKSSLNLGPELMDLWRRSGEAKMEAMLEYVEDLITAGNKILIFAHHQNILDAFERAWMTSKVRTTEDDEQPAAKKPKKVREAGFKWVRIDGKTPPAERQAICTSFQTDTSIRVALLSITAASTGLTLTAAQTVVFAELFWNPGTLLQAEDRAHRIGQQDCVNVHYLLAKGTSDDTVWPLILKKLTTLESIGVGRNELGSIAKAEMEPGQMMLDRFVHRE